MTCPEGQVDAGPNLAAGGVTTLSHWTEKHSICARQREEISYRDASEYKKRILRDYRNVNC